MNDWYDYAGELPEGTTHVQLLNGEVVAVDAAGDSEVIRYYGPALVVNSAPPAIPPILPEHYAVVGQACLDALLRGQLITLTHPAGYTRCGLGIPAKRGERGTLTHEYRPLVVLEWLDEQARK